MTPQERALLILYKTTYINPMRVREFALKMWPDSKMHRKVSNQGNGATSGKAAWLCAGSYLSKLKIKGLVNRNEFGYYIIKKPKT